MTSFFVIQRFFPQKIVRTRTCFAADPRPTSTSTSTLQPSETGRVPKTNDNEHVNYVMDNDNDNDNDTLREVPHPSNEGLAL